MHDCKQRLNLVKQLCAEFDIVEVSDYECSKQQISYTIDTVLHFSKLYQPKTIYLIIGKDNLAELHGWKNIEELRNLVTFVVANRNGFDNFCYKYQTLDVNINISSTQIRQKVKQLEQRIKDITEILDSKKAENIEVFDVKDKGYLVDFVVVATTLNNRHGYALLDYLKEDLKPKGEEFLRVDEDDDWTVVDLGDIFIHLMSDKYRERYNIEEFLKEIATKK